MTLNRRELLKIASSTAVAGGLETLLPHELLANSQASAEQAPVKAPVRAASSSSIERAPERIIQSEPTVELNPDGQARIAWQTVVPTSGGTIYWGVPNDEVMLDWPIYNAGEKVNEASAGVMHEARIDVRDYAQRYVPRLMMEGGTLAYRLEMFDPRKGSAQFIDRHFSFKVENGQFLKAVTILEGPFLTEITPESAVVWWVTDQAGLAELRLNREGKTTVFRAEGPRPQTQCIVRVTGLSPNTKYEYEAVSRSTADEIKSRQYSLKTAPRESQFSFVFTCDGRTGGLGGGETALEGVNGTSARALATQMARHAPDFLMFSGDLISGYTTREDDFRAQLRSWKRIYGPFWHNFPIYTGMGNHESLINILEDGTQADKQGDQSAEAVFASEFVNPMNGPEPERPGLPPYKGNVYSFNYGGCHFVQLNSDYWYSSRPEQRPGNPFGRFLPGQLQWMENDLRSARAAGARHIFLFLHEPAFPNGGHVQDSLWEGGKDPGVGVRDRFWSIVATMGATAVFCGHEHNYSRMLIDRKTPVHRDGSANPEFVKPVWQITQGAAGAPFYARDENTPWARHVQKFVSHTWSYCLVRVQGARVRLETYSYTGELLDQADLA